MAQRLTRPSRVKIGPHTMRIMYSEESWKKYTAKEKVHPTTVGMTLMRPGILLVRSKKLPSETFLKDTVIHEIFHAIFRGLGWPHSFNLGTYDEERLEEVLVSLASPMWFAVLRDNPVLSKWLLND